jgi:flavin reductase (DIM6/NTAB) family NADH-FMN oxidoreductase RutF
MPGWVCVGHPDPDDQVRVMLEYGGEEVDVSRCHRMVALAPLTIAVGDDAPLKARLGGSPATRSPVLPADVKFRAGQKAGGTIVGAPQVIENKMSGKFALLLRSVARRAIRDRTEALPRIFGGAGAIVVREREPAGCVLGRIDVKMTRSLEVCGSRIDLFEAGESRNYCVSRLRGAVIRSYETWKAARDRNPRNIRMTPSDMFAMWILHDVPRPVVAVTYGSEEQGNLFPMDLVGPLTDRCYVLGLHSSSPAIPLIRETGMIAVSEMPIEAKSAVYALGSNHREASLDVRKLPIATIASPVFGIPVPAEALAVRELAVEEVINLGSHHLFVTSVKSFERKSAGARMTHIHRLYQQYLTRQGKAL